MAQAIHFENTQRDAEAYTKYVEVIRLEPNHVQALCKASELSNILGKRQTQKKLEQQFYNASYDFAIRAIKLAPNDANANFVMSVSMGRLAMEASGAEKIQAVKDVKTYAERAIRGAPNNYKSYHVLGKWHYEVSSLSAFEKWLVRITFGGLPEASFNEALRNFEKSKQLNPALLINYLELARTYIKLDQIANAKGILKALQKMPNTDIDDPQVKADAQIILRSIDN
jgi:tetratricopeptide (TPR) repeat protein